MDQLKNRGTPSTSGTLPSRATALLVGRFETLLLIFEKLPDWPLLLLFVGTYFPITIVVARHKLIWDDEFFTLYLSRSGGMQSILAALRTGADQHPPPFYYLTHLVTSSFGLSHLTLRLASIAGFGLLCVSLFYILSRGLPRLWAFTGMLLPLVTGAYYYATEARGYALMMGFCCLAMLAWQNATSRGRRAVWLSILFSALTLAVSSHYYSVLILIPLCMGEAARSYLLKRIDIGVLIAFCGAVVPLVIFLPTIRHAHEYSSHFWAVPYWSAVLNFYPLMAGAWTNVALIGASLYILAIYWFASNGTSPDERRPVFAWEAVAWASVAAIPVLAMILAKVITHGYTERYALPALIGAVVIGCQTGFRSSRRNKVFPLFVCLAALLYFAVQARLLVMNQSITTSAFVNEVSFLSRYVPNEIILGDVTLFHRISFYAPRDFVQNFTYMPDPDCSARYLGQDTVDRGMLDLRPWFPLKVIPRESYISTHRHFLTYGTVGQWNWITDEITPPNYETRLVERRRNNLLLATTYLRSAPGQQQSETEELAKDALFQQMSTNGPSLCVAWMPDDKFCLAIERQRRAARTPAPPTRYHVGPVPDLQ